MRRWVTILIVIILGLALSGVGAAWATEEKKDRPPRGIVAAILYPGITVSSEEDVKVDLIVKNIGLADETIFFEILEKPEGWDAWIKGYGKVVSGVFLSEDQDRTMTFIAEPADGSDPQAGTYRFVVQARSADGVLESQSTLEVVVIEGEVRSTKEIELNTSYPVLKGPTDARFEFSLEVKNSSEEDQLFNLAATGPEGWDISFKPAYEQKQISSLQIKANQTKSVGIEVKPSILAEVDQYPVKVLVATKSAEAEVDLTVELTGTYKIKAGTPSGLLSLSTQTGTPANISLYVRNEGSAEQRQVSFVSFKPENWKVEFAPETLDAVAPGELRQVEVTITPAKQALVGDYSVAINAQGEKANSQMELRVTVKASAAWGWIGVAIIVGVIVGLAFVFRRLGRR